MGKTKATLDTNILISALGWKGNPKKVFEKFAGFEGIQRNKNNYSKRLFGEFKLTL